MPRVSRYHSGSVKVRAAQQFNFANFHTAFRNKSRRKKPVATVPSSSAPHTRQVLHSGQPFLPKRRRVPTRPASTMVKAWEAFPQRSISSLMRLCCSRRWSQMGPVNSASALAILSRKLLISSSGRCSMKSAITSLLANLGSPRYPTNLTGYVSSSPSQSLLAPQFASVPGPSCVRPVAWPWHALRVVHAATMRGRVLESYQSKTPLVPERTARAEYKGGNACKSVRFTACAQCEAQEAKI